MLFSRLRFLLLFSIFLLFSHTLRADDVTVDDADANETVITLRVELCPDPVDDPATPEKEGPTKEEVQQFVDEKLPGILAIWNVCTKKFRINRGAARKTIRFVFEISVLDDCEAARNPDKKRMKVHLGRAPSSSGIDADAQNLWLENTPKTIAHEFGHAMGLDEEYQQHGPTRANLMGRDETPKLEPYHVMTVLFMNYGNPDAAEKRRRANMQFFLRMKDQKRAKQLAADNGITNAEYDAYKDQFDANASQMQPGAPSRAGQ